jgi:hypothetical protein
MLSNTAIAENQPFTFANLPVENRHADPFTVRGGRYVGHDGFVVPKDFDEFDQRFPHFKYEKKCMKAIRRTSWPITSLFLCLSLRDVRFYLERQKIRAAQWAKAFGLI